MPGQPFRKLFMTRVKEAGGWSVIFDRIASGETLTAVAKDYGCSRSWLSRVLNEHPKRRELLGSAKREGAAALADQTVQISDTVLASRDEVAKARLQSENRRWLAAALDRETFGETKQEGVTLNIDAIYLAALKRVNGIGVRPVAALPETTTITGADTLGLRKQLGTGGEASVGQLEAVTVAAELPLPPLPEIHAEVVVGDSE